MAIKRSKLARGIAKTVFDYLPFGFGLDQVTPSNQTVPGSLRESRNYEININGGYTGIDGYERFDGQASPSVAIYHRLDVTITGSFSVGDTVTDTTTTETGVVVAVNTTYDATQAFLILTKVSGSFGSGNTLNVSGSPEGTTDGANVASGAPTTQLDAFYKNLAADEYRGDIAAVPGSGNILGVWLYNDVLYSFRNNAGGTAADMFKSTSSGWSQVALGFELAFTSGGTTEIVDGNVIDGLVGGSPGQATVTRVVLESGSWAAGTAVGRFIFASQTGTFEAGGVTVSAAGDMATIAGDSSPITLLPDGRFEFETFAFGGAAGSEKMYGADTVNRGFEFDGTTFVPIVTGMDADTPRHIAAFKNHLFFSFAGSAQHSGIGTPYSWTIISGASELAVGDTITAFEVQPGSSATGTMAIMSRNRIHMLNGTSSADWQLIQYRKEVGAFPYSVEEFGITLMMDDRGIVALHTVQAHGNFKHGVASRLVQPFVNTHKTLVSASCIAREKSQYRLFFTDDTALYVTMDNNKVKGIMTQTYAHTVKCICSLEAGDGSEEMYFGSDNGFVYQLDKGTSFDGDNIDRLLKLNYHHAKSPRIEKSYFDASMEVAGVGYATFDFRYELGYSQSDIPQPSQRVVDLGFTQAKWDTFVWDNFVWDGVVLSPSNIDLDGDAENISLIFASSSDYFAPITISGALIRQAYRKQLRS